MSKESSDKPGSSPCIMDEFPDYNGLSHLSRSQPDSTLSARPGLEPKLESQAHSAMQILSSNTIIYCNNWKACCHFYMDVLNLNARFSKDDWFHELIISDSCYISIADQSRCSIEPAQGHGLTLSFHVQDLHVWHKHLIASGAEPTTIKTNSWRAPFFFVRDPDNNRIEFWTMKS